MNSLNEIHLPSEVAQVCKDGISSSDLNYVVGQKNLAIVSIRRNRNTLTFAFEDRQSGEKHFIDGVFFSNPGHNDEH
jgi:hypothetical protein